jgi:hypothetical protein
MNAKESGGALMPDTLAEDEGKVMPTGNVERDIGRIEGALKAHEDRMDRTDVAHASQFKAINDRFDGVTAHLDKQDEKLNLLITRTNREDGADEAEAAIVAKDEAKSQKRLMIYLAGAGVIATLIGALLEAHWHFV